MFTGPKGDSVIIENKIYSEGECVILEAVSGSDFIRVADRLAYSLLNID